MERRAIIAALLMAALLICLPDVFHAIDRKSAAATKAETPEPSLPPPLPQLRRRLPPPAAPLAAPTVPDRTGVCGDAPLSRRHPAAEAGAITVWDVHFRGDRPMVWNGILGPIGIAGVVAAAGASSPFSRLSTESVSLGAQTPRASCSWW